MARGRCTLGISFGSHLALATMKRYGRYIERAVRAGAEGPDHTVKLPSALDDHLAHVGRTIAADPRAGRLLPDFEGLVRRVIGELEQGPREVRLGADDAVNVTNTFLCDSV